MFDELRRVALFTSGVVELTRHQAEKVVKDLVKNGDVRRQQAAAAVKELVDTSRVARGELLNLVRAEIQNQISGLGLVTKRDLDRLERRVTRVEDRTKATRKASGGRTASTKTGSSKTGTSKTTTRSSGTRGGTNPPSKRTP